MRLGLFQQCFELEVGDGDPGVGKQVQQPGEAGGWVIFLVGLWVCGRVAGCCAGWADGQRPALDEDSQTVGEADQTVCEELAQRVRHVDPPGAVSQRMHQVHDDVVEARVDGLTGHVVSYNDILVGSQGEIMRSVAKRIDCFLMRELRMTRNDGVGWSRGNDGGLLQ